VSVPRSAAFQTAIKEASEWIAAAATIAAAPPGANGLPPESTSQGVFSSRSVWTGEAWVAEERRHCSQGEELTKYGGVYKQAWTSKEDQSQTASSGRHFDAGSCRGPHARTSGHLSTHTSHRCFSTSASKQSKRIRQYLCPAYI